MIATSMMPCLVERGADRADAAVHHVRRRDDVDARLRRTSAAVRDQQLERCVVVDVAAVVEDAAVAVVGVLAVAEIGRDHHLGQRRFDRADRALHDAVRIVS